MTHAHDTADRLATLRTWASLERRMDTGNVFVRGTLVARRTARVRLVLTRGENVIYEERFSPDEFAAGVSFRDIPVRIWWPQREGEQSLFTLAVSLLDADEGVLDACERRIGFKHIEWPRRDDAGEPGECVVNGRPIALTCADWAPQGPNDPGDADRRLAQHRDRGVNCLRVTAPEAPAFYDRCDELGLLVWQALPPGAGDAEQGAVAREEVLRLQHHVSLLMWSGSEAQRQIVAELDPTRRFRLSAP